MHDFFNTKLLITVYIYKYKYITRLHSDQKTTGMLEREGDAIDFCRKKI